MFITKSRNIYDFCSVRVGINLIKNKGTKHMVSFSVGTTYEAKMAEPGFN